MKNFQINEDLTPDSVGEFGLEWVEDKIRENVDENKDTFYGNPKK